MPLPKAAVRTVADVTTVTAELTHSVSLARVPDKTLIDRYVSRMIHGVRDVDVLRYALETATNVLIEGPTGPGKTMVSRTFAALHDLYFYSIPTNVGIEPSQMFGKYIPDGMDEHGKQLLKWQDGGLTFIARNGGVLLINEVNFMPERVASAIFGLLDERRELVLLDHKGETIRAHRPDCWCDLRDSECRKRWVLIVADMNPGYSGTRPLNAAFRNRFPIQLDWDYLPDVEEKLVRTKSLLRHIAPGLRSDHREGKLLTPTSTNMMMEFDRLAVAMGYDFAVMNFVNHFPDEERNGVKMAFDAFESNIRQEIASFDDTGEEDPNWRVFADDAKWIYEQEPIPAI